MRMLFTIDLMDYDPSAPVFRRPSARGIIRKEGQLLMIYSRKYGYYKFPGGGIEAGEDPVRALCREVQEEAGRSVLPGSVEPYGQVHRIQKGVYGDTFVQDNYYYLCGVMDEEIHQQLDAYEADEGFTPRYVTPQEAIATNRQPRTDEKDAVHAIMTEREARVMEMLMAEGLI